MHPQACPGTAVPLTPLNVRALARRWCRALDRVTDFELVSREVSPEALAKMRSALEANGVEFINARGVKLKG
jgi:hypothetical protein